MEHNDIYKFIRTFYKIYKTNNSELLKQFYFETFSEWVHIDDIECENDDRNTCLFDELYDDLIDRIRWTIQCIWSILYCEAIDDTFLISKWSDQLLLNWEPIDKKDYDAFEYFYDLMFVW